jgi:dTDP-4-dehydrorhamnose reductase
MKVLVTGANGQLGYELARSCPDGVEIIPTDADTLDITDADAVEAAFEQHRPDRVINGAAYTAVDKAESDTDAATAINATAAGTIARHCAQHSVRMVQISTDFVFGGLQSTPYLPDAATRPVNVYGATKREGELSVLRELPDALIIRTSWLYSAHGNNFVKSMLNLMQSKDQLGIVVDQAGSPTWAATLADVTWKLMEKHAKGIYHCADNGIASWYDFAVAIQEEAMTAGLLHKAIPVKPIRTEEYPTPATRPAYSVMDKQSTETLLGESLPHWRVSLRKMLAELEQKTLAD